VIGYYRKERLGCPDFPVIPLAFGSWSQQKAVLKAMVYWRKTERGEDVMMMMMMRMDDG